MNIGDCLKKGLLRKDKPDKQKAIKSLEMAKHKLDTAHKTMNARIYEDTVMNVYAAMFHSGRAVLYHDGYTEKSHYAVYVYLKDRCWNKIEPKYINEFNNIRLERHEILYGLEKTDITPHEAKELLHIAESFVDQIRQLLI